MNTTEQQFSQLVRDNRSTIYAVCYMFSNDADEVADLFQEILINLWKGSGAFRGDASLNSWIWKVSSSISVCFGTTSRSQGCAQGRQCLQQSEREIHIANRIEAENIPFQSNPKHQDDSANQCRWRCQSMFPEEKPCSNILRNTVHRQQDKAGRDEVLEEGCKPRQF